MKQNDFDAINNDLKTTDIYSHAKNIPDISNAHQIQIVDGKIVTNDTSAQGYE